MTRKEAIETIRRCCPKVGDSQCYFESALRELVPELAESDGERIRKTLIEALKTSETVGELKFILPEPMREDAIAYLEKQKEHPNGCFTCDEYKKGYEAGRLNGITAGYNKAIKEQKPAEWSEEDEKMVNNILYVLGQYIDYKVVSGTGTGYATPRYGKEIDWLKSLRPQPHWKPSEEQMDALRVTLEYMPDTFKPRCTLMTLQNDLEKLM